MSKTLIVAQREFVENLRTKTFWIGIFALPVIFALSIFISRFMEENKDVRTYAVLDQTEGAWLSTAIERRADDGDLLTAMTGFVGDLVDKDAKDATLAVVRERLPKAIETHGRNEVRREFFTRLGRILDEGIRKAETEGVQSVTVAQISALGSSEDLLDWYRSLTPEQRAQLEGKIDRAKYHRLELGDLGVATGSELEVATKTLNAAIADGRLFGYFVIPADPLAVGAGNYVSNNFSDSDLRDWFSGNATEVVRKRRIAALEGVSEAQARRLLDAFPFERKQVTATGEIAAVAKKDQAIKWAPIAFVYLLWIAVFTAAQMLLTNTVEEKSNRLIEVLLSSVSPLQLMSGKVLGIALTGLTIVVSWALTAIAGAKLVPATSKIAELGLSDIVSHPIYLTSFVAYFLAGYLLYAAILVALGSVCDSLKEAQNLLQPVFILLIVPLLAMLPVVQDPNGMIARVMTYIPIYTPFLMMNRAGGPPPAWEYLASSAVIVVSLVIAFWAAGKIFRIGILMTGKPPRIREILGWLRAPVGAVHTRHEQGPTSP